MLACTYKRLLRDGKGRIAGVVAEAIDGEITVAAGSVIVATGGYGNNKEMLKKYCAYYHDTFRL